jgi:hypothetical protein
MERKLVVQALSIILCISLLVFLSATYEENSNSSPALLETDINHPFHIRNDYQNDLINDNNILLPISRKIDSILRNSNGAGTSLETSEGTTVYNPVNLPVSHRSLGFDARMLQRAAFLARAVNTLEKGPSTPSWSWEKLQEDKREDPLLMSDAFAAQASTAQQVAALLRKNLAEADAQLKAKRDAARKALERKKAKQAPEKGDAPGSASENTPQQIRVSNTVTLFDLFMKFLQEWPKYPR